MSSRVSVKEEIPEMERQMGCMNGLLQLFDRNYLVHGRRLNQKRLPSAGHNAGKIAKEKQRILTESSSRTSCSSSSSCSSFSSPVDPPSLTRTAPAQHFLKNPTLDSRQFYQSTDLREVVKNSIDSQAPGLSVKTVSTKPALGHTMKHVDSPRPTQPRKFSEELVSESNTSTLQVQVPKSARRHSYDGREATSLDTTKSSIKLKELPRLSLDSRDYRSKSSGSGTRSTEQTLESPISNRPSTVIAKLMGLEAFPDSTSAKPDSQPRSPVLKITTLTMNPSNSSPILTQISPNTRDVAINSPQTTYSVYGEIEKRLATLEFKKSGKDLRALKQILEAMQKTKESMASDNTSQSSNTSNLDNSSELASPYMHRDKTSSSPARTPISPKSYKSQIIVMKPTKITRKERDSASLGQPSQKVASLQKLQTNFTDTRREKLNNELPTDLTPRDTHPGQTSTQPLSPIERRAIIRRLKTVQISKVPQHVNGEFSTISASMPVTLSPRLHLKFALEKQSSSDIPSSDSRSTRSQYIRHRTESCSAETNLKNKAQHFNQNSNAQERKKRSEIRGNNALYLQSKNIPGLAQEGASICQYDKVDSRTTRDDCKQNDSTAQLSRIVLVEESPLGSLEQPSPVSVLDSTLYPEDLSPVKKKIYAFKDDPNDEEVCLEWETQSRMHVDAEIDHKKVENIQQLGKNLSQVKCINEEKIMDCILLSQEKVNPHHLYISEILLASGLLRAFNLGFGFLQLHSSGHLINPKLFFVLEQIQESTWSSDGEKSWINMPKSQSNQRAQRRLVFDTVNEILAGKIEAKGTFKLSLSESVEASKEIKAQQLLKDLCYQVDQLQCANHSAHLDETNNFSQMVVSDDLVCKSTNWTGCQNEVSGLALDIERLIFKDLVTELVVSEAGDLRDWSVGCCRRLFSA